MVITETAKEVTEEVAEAIIDWDIMEKLELR